MLLRLETFENVFSASSHPTFDLRNVTKKMEAALQRPPSAQFGVERDNARMIQ